MEPPTLRSLFITSQFSCLLSSQRIRYNHHSKCFFLDEQRTPPPPKHLQLLAYPQGRVTEKRTPRSTTK